MRNRIWARSAADGVRILYTRDDDGGVGWNSRARFTATDAGTYYLVAGASSVIHRR